MSFLVGHLNDAESSSVRFSKGKSPSQRTRRKFFKYQEEDRLKLPISTAANLHPFESTVSLSLSCSRFMLRLFLTFPFLNVQATAEAMMTEVDTIDIKRQRTRLSGMQ
jgi:hypothetical protein